MTMKEIKRNWLVVYTKPRWEKKVAERLTDKGIENYCPLNLVRRKWSDRYKNVQEPLFKGYVFVRPAETERWVVNSVNGVLNYVYWLGKPAVVSDAEIDNIKKFLSDFEDVQVVDINVNPSDTVAITKGILMDYQGTVLEVHGNLVKVDINSLGLRLTATIPKANLQKLHTTAANPG